MKNAPIGTPESQGPFTIKTKYLVFPTISGKTWNETPKFSHRTSCEIILSIYKPEFYQITRYKVKKIIKIIELFINKGLQK
jgi:hypothetical protein